MRSAIRILACCFSVVFVKGDCPTPTTQYTFSSPTQYAFAVGTSVAGCNTAVSIPSLGIDGTINDALGAWTSANQTQNPSEVVFSWSSSTAVPYRFWASRVASGVYGCDPGVAAHTDQNVYTGTDIVFSAETYFFFGSVDSVTGSQNIDEGAGDYLPFIYRITLHEVGHTMGLKDQPINGLQVCGGQTAQQSVMNAECGTNDSATNIPDHITNCDNASVR